MSTCCPQRLLWKEKKIRAVTVNNNKLLSVNKKKTPLGSKFTRICMGTFLSRNCGQTKHQALKLGEWHPDMTGNMMKARLRMSDQVRYLRGRDTTVTVAKRNRCLAIIPCSRDSLAPWRRFKSLPYLNNVTFNTTFRTTHAQWEKCL